MTPRDLPCYVLPRMTEAQAEANRSYVAAMVMRVERGEHPELAPLLDDAVQSMGAIGSAPTECLTFVVRHTRRGIADAGEGEGPEDLG